MIYKLGQNFCSEILHLLQATNIVKDSDKEKYVYCGCGIEFDGKGEWSLNNGYAGNVIILELIIVHHLMLIISRIFF